MLNFARKIHREKSPVKNEVCEAISAAEKKH